LELTILQQIFDDHGPDIIGLYGIAGVGKSTLLAQFVEKFPKHCLKIDCQAVEPTPKGFLRQLHSLLSCANDLDSISCSFPPNTVLILDQFESCILIESWLRRDFMPNMRKDLKLILSGRLHPDNQWVLTPPLNRQFRCLKVNSLPLSQAVDYLQQQGHSKILSMGINQFASGHPLALKLASSAMLEEPNRQLSEIPPNKVIQTLVSYFAEDIKDPELRCALEAASIVRRINESLLSAMLEIDHTASSKLYEKLSKINFVDSRVDGLNLHDVLKNVMSSNLKMRSPTTYCDYRNRACQTLLQELHQASSSQLWRYTADMLYMVDNPVIRSAFFPPNDSRSYSVEPAQESDKAAVMDIIQQHEPDLCLAYYSDWWSRHLNAFHCVRDSRGSLVGFYCLIKPDEVSPSLLQHDPLTAAWSQHLSLSTRDSPEVRKSIFIRRWLSLNDGESLSGVQAACWLDIKRTYLEMRPELRTVYLALNDLQPYASVATELGFQVLDLDVSIAGRTYYTAMLDMGEHSVDGWISKRLLHEISQENHMSMLPDWFDKQARQLNVNGKKIDLTPLELGTLELLIRNPEAAVTRKDLLKDVWGIEYEGSSNVVDTIIRSLRKKLHDRSTAIQSVRGVGYRYTNKV
jgi:hypothetical protein